MPQDRSPVLLFRAEALKDTRRRLCVSEDTSFLEVPLLPSWPFILFVFVGRMFLSDACMPSIRFFRDLGLRQ